MKTRRSTFKPQKPGPAAGSALRLCEICGARVTNMNPKVTTCGPICTEAKHKGRTYKHQMRIEANKTSPFYTCQ